MYSYLCIYYVQELLLFFFWGGGGGGGGGGWGGRGTPHHNYIGRVVERIKHFESVSSDHKVRA